MEIKSLKFGDESPAAFNNMIGRLSYASKAKDRYGIQDEMTSVGVLLNEAVKNSKILAKYGNENIELGMPGFMLARKSTDGRTRRDGSTNSISVGDHTVLTPFFSRLGNFACQILEL